MRQPGPLSDVDPDVLRIQIEGYRRMTPQEKLRRVDELNRAVRELALAGIRERHGPDLSEEEERMRLAALRLDRETMIRVWGWDPEIHGL